MAHEIFISYRRKDVGGYAGRLYDHLCELFGRDGVLFDVEVEGTAEPLREWVARVMPDAAVALVLVGEQWLIDRNGRRRLHERDDIVRLEVELALRHGVPIIPVIVDGALFPAAADLPESIRELTLFKGYEINNSYWKAKVEPLVQAIFSVTKTHVPILKRGVAVWNAWRAQNPGLEPNLAFGDFSNRDLDSANLSHANLQYANLSHTTLKMATLASANLNHARLSEANLEAALLSNCTLRGANLAQAGLKNADLHGADLSDANLNEVNLEGARISDCWVYGVSVWGARLENALQENLLLTRVRDDRHSAITVDSLEMAVVVHLLMSSGGVRELIDVVSSKMVLILGRFTEKGLAVSATVKKELRARNYMAVTLDFARPDGRDITETISLLSHLSRFIVADLGAPHSIPVELTNVVPQLPSVPVVPLIEREEAISAQFQAFRRFPWVLEPVLYSTAEELASGIDDAIISRVETYLKQTAGDAVRSTKAG